MPVVGAAASRGAGRKNKDRNEDENQHTTYSGVKPHGSKKVSPESDFSKKAPQKGFFKYQERVFTIYSAANVQWFVAGLIMANFFVNIVTCQMDPFSRHKDYKHIWPILEDLFNWIFLIELLINMYGSWAWKFWNNSWNVFDFVVVIVGMLSVARIDLPGPLGLLRMLRAFRVFRLFKRIESLNKIIVALTRAVPGVMNAFIVLLLVMCIYAILAVDFFGQFGVEVGYVDGTLSSFYETNKISSTSKGGVILSDTPRLYPYGDEYWGNFGRSIYSLFQVLTGESWSEVIARPLLFGKDTNGLGVALYFVSFILLCSIVLINVVVAVLLEKMVDNPEEDFVKDEAIINTVVEREMANQGKASGNVNAQGGKVSEAEKPTDSLLMKFDPSFHTKTRDIKTTNKPSPKEMLSQPSSSKGPTSFDDTAREVDALREDLTRLRSVLVDVIHLKSDISMVRRELLDTKSSLGNMQQELLEMNTVLVGAMGLAPMINGKKKSKLPISPTNA